MEEKQFFNPVASKPLRLSKEEWDYINENKERISDDPKDTIAQFIMKAMVKAVSNATPKPIEKPENIQLIAELKATIEQQKIDIIELDAKLEAEIGHNQALQDYNEAMTDKYDAVCDELEQLKNNTPSPENLSDTQVLVDMNNLTIAMLDYDVNLFNKDLKPEQEKFTRGSLLHSLFWTTSTIGPVKNFPVWSKKQINEWTAAEKQAAEASKAAENQFIDDENDETKIFKINQETEIK